MKEKTKINELKNMSFQVIIEILFGWCLFNFFITRKKRLKLGLKLIRRKQKIENLIFWHNLGQFFYSVSTQH